MKKHCAVTSTTIALGLALLLSLSMTACGDNSVNDVLSAPSSVAGTAAINGTVMSGSASNLTISVPAAGLSSNVSSDGRFSIQNVPGGRIELRLTGPGLDIRIDLGIVSSDEVVTVTIRVNGNTAVVESVTRRMRDDDDEITGVVMQLNGSCPNRTFRLGQRTVRTNGGTVFRRVTCELLVNGQLVEVEGRPDASGMVLATEVQLEGTTEVERIGAIDTLRGSCPNISFSINGRIFFTNHLTEFRDRSCTQLREGHNVEAKGHTQSNGQVLAERVRSR